VIDGWMAVANQTSVSMWWMFMIHDSVRVSVQSVSWMTSQRVSSRW